MRGNIKPEAANPGPRFVLQLDLDDSLPALPAETPSGRPYHKALVTAKLHGIPVAVVEVEVTPGVETPPTLLAALLWPKIRGHVNNHLREDDLPEVSLLNPWTGLGSGYNGMGPSCCRYPTSGLSGSDVSVVIPTVGRSPVLRSLLHTVLGGAIRPHSVVVALNEPSDRSVEAIVRREFKDEPVSVVHTFRRGAAHARNVGAGDLSTPVVAFLDDDVVVDPGWLSGILRGFGRDDAVNCVTGLILPASLDTPAQIRLQQFGGFDKGTVARLYDLRGHAVPHPLYPYLPGAFGSGANFAIRRETFGELGGFDERLGPGTATRGGEDIDLLMRVVLRGHVIAYEPQALVQHHHRTADEDLRRTMFGYGLGLGAVMWKQTASRGARRDLARRLPHGLRYLLSPGSPKNTGMRGEAYPASLRIAELAGIVSAPIGYARSRTVLSAD